MYLILFSLFTACGQDDGSSMDVNVVTLEPLNVSKSGATCRGKVLYNDNYITERGICWGVNPKPSENGNIEVVNTEDENYSVKLTGLVPGNTYYYCAFIIVDGSIKLYGDVVSFTVE